MPHVAHLIGDEKFLVSPMKPTPPADLEVQLEIAYTGICGTDLHIRHGAMSNRLTLPAVLGHEVSARIARIGPGVRGWEPGEAVTVMPLRWCDQCTACRAGHRHICHNLDFLGIDSPGSLQSHWTVAADVLVRLPEHMPLLHGALVEPTAVAVHDVRWSGLAAHDRAVVIGGGPVGVLIASVARAKGADVLLIEVDDHRRRLAQELGFPAFTADEKSAANIQQWASDHGVDVVFEVSGSQAGLDLAVDVVAARGVVTVVGIHPERRRIDAFRLFWREVTLKGARLYERADFQVAVDLIDQGQIPVSRLVSRTEPLNAVESAFDLLGGGGDVMKVLIDCQAADPA